MAAAAVDDDGATSDASSEQAAKPAKKAATTAPDRQKWVPDDPKDNAPMKSAGVAREDNLTYELKHLAAFDISPLHPKTDFMAYTRDTVQLLINKAFTLERKETDEGPVALLPKIEEKFKLPRSKPAPKIKVKTRFQQFMEDRAMKKQKRSQLVFDEVAGDWKRRWGFNSTKHNEDKSRGILEVKKGANPFENPFDKDATERKLMMAKQKMREVRNKVEALGGKIRASVPQLQGESGANNRGKEGLKEAVKRAQVSTGSRGKFDRVAPNEATNLQPRAKRPGSVTYSTGQEKERMLKFAGKTLSGEGTGHIDRAKAAKLAGTAGPVGGDEAHRVAKRGPAPAKRRSKQGSKNKGSRKGR